MNTPRVALVAPALAEGGGVPAVAHFLYRVIADAGRHHPELISVAMSSRDWASVGLVRPATWLRGVRIEPGECEGRSFRHVGAFLTEFEFQRYRPRRTLTRLLDEFDLVQIVAGTPAWAMLAAGSRPPVALQVATLADVERREALARPPDLRTRWLAMMTRVTSRLDAAALRHVDAVFVENGWMQDWVAERIGAEKTIFAPPGVDTDFFRPADSAPTGDGYFLSVGRFADPRKNVRLMFEAYELLKRRHPAAPRLVLAGQTGPTDDDWSVARSLGIADDVDCRLDVSKGDLAGLYASATAFVLSSDEEGLGIVILEAMSAGLPVVSTDCGGPATSVVEGGTGYLVPVGQAEPLADRMSRVLEDPERSREMGRAGRSRAVDRFSLQATGRLFLDCYDRLIAARRK